MKWLFPMLAGPPNRAWKPALGPSSLRAVIVSFPGMTGHQGNLVPHSLAAQGVP